MRLVLFRLSTNRNLYYPRYRHFLLDGYGQIPYWRRLPRACSALASGQESPTNLFGCLAELTDEESAYAVHRSGAAYLLIDPELSATACASRCGTRVSAWC